MKQVSAIVPCRNEAAHIGAFCAALAAQRLPPGWTLQVIVAAGASDDGTRAALDAWAAGDARFIVIDNPRRIVSTGLNLALARADGEVIVRMDVHTHYADDYIAQCLAALQATGADNVGGPWHAQADAGAPAMQQAIAAAFQSRWVAGGAASRRLDWSGWTDTVYLGCWPRESFERFGGFDEALVRNQDDEHNLRIRRGGGRVWQSAQIHSLYRPRESLAQTFRQYLQYGYWKPFVMRKHGQAASLLVPGLFVALAGLFALLVLFGRPGLLIAWLALYGLAVAALTAAVAVERRPGVAALLRVPAVVAAYHLGYGLGSLRGWFDVLRGRAGDARFAGLTR
jgi:glycosyltransferase involved in cell wall biosynthesis